MAAAQAHRAIASHAVQVRVDPLGARWPLNGAILGSNVQWTDNGDNLLWPDGTRNEAMQAAAQAVGPTVIRYPGGTQADAFHWDAPENLHVFTGQMQPTTMDTQRVLEFCERTGAQPMFQVNLVTGTTDEAAAWLRTTNVDGLVSSVTGQRLPSVTRWEMGNEPYLQNGQMPSLDLSPADYAARVNAFIPALRAVDPSIRVGLPLTTDQRNGVWVTPYQGFAREVLAAVDQRFDFVCLHDAYMPFVTDGTSDPRTLYYAAMAGAPAVEDDLAAMRALLASARPGESYPLAITEWAPLFSNQGLPTDGLILSPTAALYAADLVRMLAAQPDVECANHWSLTGNWWFGAVSQTGFNRAIADTLTLVRGVITGSRLDSTVTCETIATPALGQVSARAAMPLATVLATRDDTTLRLLVINKDLDRRAAVALDLAGVLPKSVSVTALRSTDAFASVDAPGAMQRVSGTLSPATTLRFNVPPHALAVVTIALA